MPMGSQTCQHRKSLSRPYNTRTGAIPPSRSRLPLIGSLRTKETALTQIEIETTCALSAETRDHVSVRFSDMFEASGPCVSDKVCSLYLKKVGSDEWRPGWVKIHQHEGGNLVQISYVSNVRKFLPENVWYGFNYRRSKGNNLPSDASFGEGS